MIIQIEDWRFQVYSVKNRKHYVRELEDRCNCDWCKNFYRSVDISCPDLRQTLERFGVLIEAPTELMSFSPTLCAAYYAVAGTVLQRGKEPIAVDGVLIEPMEKEESMVNFDDDGPVFFLYVGCLSLPWVLDKPMEEAQSPAKGKNYIQRLFSRWIEEA